MCNLSCSNRGTVITNLLIQLNQVLERVNVLAGHIGENTSWKDDVFIRRRLGECYEEVG